MQINAQQHGERLGAASVSNSFGLNNRQRLRLDNEAAEEGTANDLRRSAWFSRNLGPVDRDP